MCIYVFIFLNSNVHISFSYLIVFLNSLCLSLVSSFYYRDLGLYLVVFLNFYSSCPFLSVLNILITIEGH